jgi:hypothetical protein
MNDWIQLQRISYNGDYALPEVESSFTFPNYKEALYLKDGYPLTFRFPDGTEERLPLVLTEETESDCWGHETIPTTSVIRKWGVTVTARGASYLVNIDTLFVLRHEIENLQKLKPEDPPPKPISSFYSR